MMTVMLDRSLSGPPPAPPGAPAGATPPDGWAAWWRPGPGPQWEYLAGGRSHAAAFAAGLDRLHEMGRRGGDLLVRPRAAGRPPRR